MTDAELQLIESQIALTELYLKDLKAIRAKSGTEKAKKKREFTPERIAEIRRKSLPK